MLTEVNGKTRVTIEINKPLAEIEGMIPVLAFSMGSDSLPPESDLLAFVIEQTKQYWFEKVKEVAEKAAEEQAKVIVEQAKAAALAQVEALKGA